MTNNQLTSTHLAVKSELDGYKIHASRGQATAMAMVRLFESIDRDLEELQERRQATMNSEPVTVPEHITYISEPTILNILANDDSSPMANAARLLAYEVRFWRSFPLYRHAQPAPVVPDDGLIAELLAIAKEAADDADAIAYAEFSDKSMRHTTAISDWERRAAMLNGGKS
ncbi:hypothetical protein L7L29_003063 [Klebsiella pneumoniae]|jgi:hypothetical protein|nr:hypothetical protein [Klebsiella pneumoniae]EKW3944090.1 hypothetical protein [Klebsiella pneumoniae]